MSYCFCCSSGVNYFYFLPLCLRIIRCHWEHWDHNFHKIYLEFRSNIFTLENHVIIYSNTRAKIEYNAPLYIVPKCIRYFSLRNRFHCTVDTQKILSASVWINIFGDVFLRDSRVILMVMLKGDIATYINHLNKNRFPVMVDIVVNRTKLMRWLIKWRWKV